MSLNLERGSTPQSLVECLIKEQIRNEGLGDPFEIRIKLLQGLIRQVPNRVYFNENGEMLRALFFKGEFPHEAYIDVIQPQNDGWETEKSEYIIGRTPKDVEDQVAFLRSRFGMRYDLLSQPDQVYKAQDSNFGITFIHIGGLEKPLVGCEYFMTNLFRSTPRFISYERPDPSRLSVEELILQTSPPSGIIDYSNRI